MASAARPTARLLQTRRAGTRGIDHPRCCLIEPEIERRTIKAAGVTIARSNRVRGNRPRTRASEELATNQVPPGHGPTERDSQACVRVAFNQRFTQAFSGPNLDGQTAMTTKSILERKQHDARDRWESLRAKCQMLKRARDHETRVEEQARIDFLIDEAEKSLAMVEAEIASIDSELVKQELPTSQKVGAPVNPTRTSTTKILFLTANPSGTAALQLDEEIRLIGQRIRRGEYRKLFEIRSAPAIRATDLPFELLDNAPEVVHFSGHGSSAGELLFVKDGDSSPHPVPAKTLARVFKQFRDRVKCVVLNACYSRIQADAIAESIPCVVGMSRAVPDATAIAFAAGFYEALAFGKSVADAFELGLTQVELTSPQLIDTADIPQLVVRSGEDARKLFLTTSHF